VRCSLFQGRVQPLNKSAYATRVSGGEAAKLDTKSVWTAMMNYFAMQRERVIMIHQKQSRSFANFDVGTCRQIANANAAETNVARLAETKRLSQALIFDCHCQLRANVIARKAPTLTIWQSWRMCQDRSG